MPMEQVINMTLCVFTVTSQSSQTQTTDNIMEYHYQYIYCLIYEILCSTVLLGLQFLGYMLPQGGSCPHHSIVSQGNVEKATFVICFPRSHCSKGIVTNKFQQTDPTWNIQPLLLSEMNPCCWYL